jgi:hypothetical protein
VNFYFWIRNSQAITIDSAHDYGYYARVYPLDENNDEYAFKELMPEFLPVLMFNGQSQATLNAEWYY